MYCSQGGTSSVCILNTANLKFSFYLITPLIAQSLHNLTPSLIIRYEIAVIYNSMILIVNVLRFSINLSRDIAGLITTLSGGL